jgi:predicted CoA-binding protein
VELKHHQQDFPTAPAAHNVVVLGASPKPARYSNQAMRLLMSHGYRVVPVHPMFEEIEGVAVTNTLNDIDLEVHTLAMYVGPERSLRMINDIVALNPWRVIFNPGTESPELENRLKQNGSECIKGCTLVMLRTNQF